MKVGMIFECGPQGADKQVCEYLAKKLIPDLKIVSVTLTNKKNLLEECGSATASLLKARCEKVLIIWDLYPPWGQKGQRPCRKTDREAILKSLAGEGIAENAPVCLVCVEQELEAWLVADGSAIGNLLSRPTHLVKVDDQKKPDTVVNPKKYLVQVFEQNAGRRYNDIVDAIKIARQITSWNKITRSPTFQRFAIKLSGLIPEGDLEV
jgi:hypothetical protein